MVLGAIIDAGVPLDDLNNQLSHLNVSGQLILANEHGQRAGVRGTLAPVKVQDQERQTYNIADFISITQNSKLPREVIDQACAIFRRLEEAEAIAHKSPVGHTQLHELGDLDTLADVVGSVVGLGMMEIDKIYASPIPLGSGTIASDHGMLPVPAPGVMALLSIAKAPVYPPPWNLPDTGETVTPTGAAIVTTMATFQQPTMILEKIGYGLGSRESLHYPNVLGLWIGRESDSSYVTDLQLIETNIDDMTPELLAYVHERLFCIGAKDVWFTPIQMKKNRPATMLSALVPTHLEPTAVALLMRETSSLGIRVRQAARYEAKRESIPVDTSLGTVTIKVKKLEGTNVTVSPEYEECRRIAVDLNLPLHDVYRRVQNEAAGKLLP